MWKWRIDCFTQVTQLFSSPEPVLSFQPSGSGNDVWHVHVQCTCSEERRLKKESLWARATMAACREGGSPPMEALLFILFIANTGQIL